jgi:hypothetical protein
MVGGKRDADAADLENHDTPVTASVTDIVASFPLAPVVIDLTTLVGILVLIETPLMNLTGTPYLNNLHHPAFHLHRYSQRRQSESS